MINGDLQRSFTRDYKVHRKHQPTLVRLHGAHLPRLIHQLVCYARNRNGSQVWRSAARLSDVCDCRSQLYCNFIKHCTTTRVCFIKHCRPTTVCSVKYQRRVLTLLFLRAARSSSRRNLEPKRAENLRLRFASSSAHLLQQTEQKAKIMAGRWRHWVNICNEKK